MSAAAADDARSGADECEVGLTQVTSDAAVDGVETAMAGLSVVDQSCSSSLPAESLLEGAAACPANTLSSVSGAAAAAAKGSGKKKKKTTKKGTRKAKQESKCKELVLYDHQTVKCGR